jgi:anti-anti-sigma regulatory factor
VPLLFDTDTGLPQNPPRPLVLDLGELDILTADRLGQLVVLHNRLFASGGRLVLCHVGRMAYGALEVTRLTELLDGRREHAGGPGREW